ncbi:MAG: DUF4339 domain-containing protein [Gemmatimonadota bacterium]|nr:DUF4339 domain-containing protein [Gemmatimonadota bacterium]
MTAPSNWYYVQQGAATGPVPSTQLESLVRAGSIRADTLVWPGAGDWLPAASSPLGWMFAGTPAPTPGLPPVFTGAGNPAPQGKYEAFVFGELTPRLEPGERFEVTAMLFTGSLLRLAAAGMALGAIGATAVARQTLFFAVATDRRLFLMQTKVGWLSLQAINLGLAEIRYDAIAQVTTGGTLNQRTTTLAMKDGSSVMLRLNAMGRVMSGQQQFQERFPQLVNQRISR